jgi:signal transduction histidine kinase
MTPLSLRTRLTLLVTLAAAVVLAALTIGFNFLLRSNLDADADRVLQARAAAVLQTITVGDGSVEVKESPDRTAPDSQFWIYDRRSAIERPPASPALQRLADSLARGREGQTAEDHRTDIRLHAVAIKDHGRRVGAVVAAISMEPYEHSASRALIGSLIFAGAALLFVVLVARLVIDRALRPVARMTAEAADWSEHDLAHRFNVGEPRDELTQLAATFDTMLARLASSLRHEQMLSAELSHELRTPLAAILTEAELALRRQRGDAEYRDALAKIASRASQLQRTLETLMAAARAESVGGLGTAPAEAVGKQAIAACEGIAADEGIDLVLDPQSNSLRVDIDADTGERILVPLIENGCRYGRSKVELAIRALGETIEFQVTDDGPGLAAEEIDRVWEPGFRGSTGVAGDHSGAGLGLALSQRLARAVGGDVTASASQAGGRFAASIPIARG